MLQSVEMASNEIPIDFTTDHSEKQIELSILPFVMLNATNMSSQSTSNEALNHHWTFYIEVRMDGGDYK